MLQKPQTAVRSLPNLTNQFGGRMITEEKFYLCKIEKPQ